MIEAQYEDIRRPPPHSAEIEQAALGSIMLMEPNQVAETVQKLDQSQFYRRSHQIIFQAIRDLQSGDYILLGDHLRERGMLDQVGGISYLTEVLNSTATWRNIEKYLTTLRDLAAKRRIHTILLSRLDQNRNGTAPADLARDLSEELRGISEESRITPDLSQCVLTSDMLKTIDIPKREDIIERVLPTQSLLMINAGRGKGKTWLALGLARACAIGDGVFLGWAIKRKARVLYVDGEMPLADMRERINQLQIPKENFLLLSVEWMILNGFTKRLNIASLEGQDLIDKSIEDLSRGGFNPDVLILDNYSALIHGIKQNDNDEWDGVNAWLIRKRHTGLSVIVLDHAGKDESKGSRGASRKEDVMDTIIQLSEVKGADPEECRFTLEFTKTRGRKPSPMKFVASLRGADFTTEEMEMNSLDELIRLVESGVESQTDIANELKITRARVCQITAKAVERGLIRKIGNRLKPTFKES
ncbi:AAA family ATPase [Candidatus Manganitrophus noduliformans]|uniref:AAA family ATPase n=1 Tax=Candidatus Manganitrophus noduliformans TaxID=2606439 RepID=A0A7X6IB53_9BACT|nr:AAA family ATPase [Candidatus Manganitrophus noduliformans]NKE71258.1 AAA family ATPase [Candidatus Manganitrophus noduliformans]